jgi:hypothetical protein
VKLTDHLLVVLGSYVEPYLQLHIRIYCMLSKN